MITLMHAYMQHTNMSTSTLLNDPRSWLLSGAHATLADALSALQPELAAAAQDLPSLNHTALPRCLPYTSLAPQIFPLRYVTHSSAGQQGSGAFVDQLPPSILDPRTRITQYGDRQPVYLVSVPDEASPVPADRVMPGAIKTKYPLPGVGHQACVAKYYPAIRGFTGILEWNGNAQDDQDEQHNVPTIHSNLPANVVLPDLVLLHILHTPASVANPATAAADDELSPPTETWIGSRDWVHGLASLLSFLQQEEEGISAGRLQLATSSLLVVTDRDLTAGQLGDTAVRNLQVLHRVLKTHTLPLHQVLVTDALGGEVVPRGVRVVVEPADASSDMVQDVDEHLIKAYVAHVRASNECKMPQPDQDVDKVQEAVEAAYVTDRRKATALDGHAGPAQLHWQLALARRVGRSKGKASVGMDEWEWARTVDAERRERVRRVKEGHKVKQAGEPSGENAAVAEPRR
ncbi:hypothetical protein BCR44DRAFT_1447471 [Catenaria anguillulae PL171]|uniref:Uncharacterized protein n=1 Tax=Catenaria anguillulae PL171 TaxID=765915 RepID=A0A1Y2H7F9_9FUNG|nr:hypothetical protein BCR44DRAFT_1447471 [Catenaria anguillulae PL171]